MCATATSGDSTLHVERTDGFTADTDILQEKNTNFLYLSIYSSACVSVCVCISLLSNCSVCVCVCVCVVYVSLSLSLSICTPTSLPASIHTDPSKIPAILQIAELLTPPFHLCKSFRARRKALQLRVKNLLPPQTNKRREPKP
jgi:hypothetical protein